MISFYIVDIILLLLLITIGSTVDPQNSAWFGEQGLAGYLWFFGSVIVYIILAIWVIVKGIILVKNKEKSKLGSWTTVVALPILPFVLVRLITILLSVF